MIAKEAVVTKVFLTDMRLCRKHYYPKKQLSVGKPLSLFKCQLHFKKYKKTKKNMFRNKTS